MATQPDERFAKQLAVVVGWSQKLEQLLKTRFRAEGSGLGAQVRSVSHCFDEPLLRAIKQIASTRNLVTHQMNFRLPDLDAFDRECEAIHQRLLQIQPRSASAWGIQARRSHFRADGSGLGAQVRSVSHQARRPSRGGAAWFGLLLVSLVLPPLGLVLMLWGTYGRFMRVVGLTWLGAAVFLTLGYDKGQGFSASQVVAKLTAPRPETSPPKLEKKRRVSDDAERVEGGAPVACTPLASRTRATSLYAAGDACGALAALDGCCPDSDSFCLSLKGDIRPKCKR